MLTVIMPMYNEGQRISASIARVAAFLASAGMEAEFLLVDDGSSDDTSAVVQNHIAQSSRIRLLEVGVNRGKGHAVKVGVRAAKGDYVLFSDADLSTPIEEAGKLIAALNDGYDIAIGSRHLPESDIVDEQPARRRAMGAAFRLLTSLVVPGIRDTQCGFKMFRRDVAQRLFAMQRIERFAFDVEILYLARRLGYSVREVPVTWRDAAGSKVRLLRDPARMALDLLRIWRWHSVMPKVSGGSVDKREARLGQRG